MILAGQKPTQIAYFVPDVRLAAARHSALFGSGPFYVADNIQFNFCRYRGELSDWDHTSGFGQWGDITVEFMQQNKPGASVLHDIVPPDSGRVNVHHLGFTVPDPKAVVDRFREQGCALALHLELTNGIEVFMVDAIRLYGHFIELYEPTPAFVAIYDFIKKQSIGFDGTDPVRSFSL